MTYAARDVKDRVIQYPGRYKLTLVAGTTDTYDLEAVPGTVTEAGTAVNRAYLLPIENALQSNDGNITTLLGKTGLNGRQFFTESNTFTAVKTGLHLIICQGKGGDGGWDYNARCSGGGGGATCIGYADLVAGTSYAVTINNSKSNFNGTFTANAGSNGYASTSSNPSGGAGGTASGGAINITGQSGRDYYGQDYLQGVGGSSMFGFGSLSPEKPSSGYGAGGSGLSYTTGTPGFVLVQW